VPPPDAPLLVAPQGSDAAEALRIAQGIYLGRARPSRIHMPITMHSFRIRTHILCSPTVSSPHTRHNRI
jgi:hypothetical protein